MVRRSSPVIRGGTIVDGSGGPTYQADIAVDNGIVSGIGKVSVLGRQEIDADGLLVMPGFIDIHTQAGQAASWCA